MHITKILWYAKLNNNNLQSAICNLEYVTYPMSTYKQFEDLPVWQKAKEIVKSIYNISGNNHFRKDYGLSNQIQRAAVSVPSNIAEGFERGSKEEFIHFLYIARGSGGEVRTQLAIAYDLNYITKAEYEDLKNEYLSVSKQINGFIEYLKGSKTKGDKFRKK